MVMVATVTLNGTARGGPHPRPRVRLQLDRCVAVNAVEVRRVVAAELGALLVDPLGPALAPSRPAAPKVTQVDPEVAQVDPEVTQVTVDCRDRLVVLRVSDPITGKSLERPIDLGSAEPSARGRLLGLAVVELVSASWTELELRPRPAVAPASRTASEEARRAALQAVKTRVPPRAIALRIAGTGRGDTFFGNARFLAGGGLRLTHDLPSGLSWSVDAVGQHGTASSSLGTTVADTISFGPAVGFQRRWPLIGLRIGGGFRGGAAHLEGRPGLARVQAGSGWGGWGGPMASVSVLFAVGRSLAVELGTEGGYVLFPVAGEVAGNRQLAIAGPWLGFQLGLGIILPGG